MKGLTFVLGALAMAHTSGLAAKNYASQLEMQNCGGYSLKAVDLQGRKAGESKWSDVKCFGNTNSCDSGSSVDIGEAVCFDLTGYKGYERFRLKGKIDAGQNKTTDDTYYKEDADQRRVFRMKGTTYNNNRPNSRGYKATLGSNTCDGNGNRRSGINCTGISWQLDQPERRRG
jgi:hypothetical protein